LLLALGGLQLALNCRTSDFVTDPYYYELARSILAKAGYGFNFRPEPMVPPGFPALLALVILTVGHSYAVLIRSMAVFTTLGLIAAYGLLKSQEGRCVAGIACLLLGSSPSLFQFSTTSLFSDMPYFFTSMFLLWAVARLDSAANRGWTLALWWTLCVLLLLASILQRSVGIALAGGILGWLAVSLFRGREAGKSRVAIFLPLVVVGLSAQAAWMFWAEQHPVSQWQVHGFQESYVAQLKLKNGNNPELGLATWQDVLKRPLENEDDMATSMVGLFGHKEMAPAWYSPCTVIPLALLLIGLEYSFRKTGGGITEWYFLSFQFLYLFWPWNFELRFQLPVAPLAALYLWRGGRLLWGWARSMPREAGTLCFIVAVLGILSSAVWGWHVRHPPTLVCIAIWLLVGCVSAVILVGGQGLMRKLSLLLESSVSVGGVPVSRAEMAGGIAMTCMLAAGVWMQTVAGLENLRRVPEMDPNIEAAEWIRGHSAADAVVMARWEARVYHYSGRRVIWFPASTDPQLLMAGIRRHHISIIVVTEDDDRQSYWKPSDRHCFRVLMRAYPALFRQVHHGAHEEVYECADVAQERGT
jgi:4-amino-4-deoxy-L-arabinose transferase-like glycosyltransferase